MFYIYFDNPVCVGGSTPPYADRIVDIFHDLCDLFSIPAGGEGGRLPPPPPDLQKHIETNEFTACVYLMLFYNEFKNLSKMYACHFLICKLVCFSEPLKIVCIPNYLITDLNCISVISLNFSECKRGGCE